MKVSVWINQLVLIKLVTQWTKNVKKVKRSYHLNATCLVAGKGLSEAANPIKKSFYFFIFFFSFFKVSFLNIQSKQDVTIFHLMAAEPLFLLLMLLWLLFIRLLHKVSNWHVTALTFLLYFIKSKNIQAVMTLSVLETLNKVRTRRRCGKGFVYCVGVLMQYLIDKAEQSNSCCSLVEKWSGLLMSYAFIPIKMSANAELLFRRCWNCYRPFHKFKPSPKFPTFASFAPTLFTFEFHFDGR